MAGTAPTKRRQGRPGNQPASERPIAFSTYVRPDLYDWLRAQASARNRGVAPFVAELIAATRRRWEEEEESREGAKSSKEL